MGNLETTAARANARLEDLVQGAWVEGLTAADAAMVVAAKWHGKDAVTVTFRTAVGAIGDKVVFRAQEPSLRVVPGDTATAFDGDPAAFRLAAEAMRIRMAARFDPMLAVTTSDIDSVR